MPYDNQNIYEIYPKNSISSPQGKKKLIIILSIIVVLFLLSTLSTASLTGTIIKYVFLVPIILFSLTLHEYAHAAMADFLGDPTPRNMGRLSLNPFRHLDIAGTLLLFFAGFGWAKPVVVEPRNFRIPKRAMLSVAVAGPLANFVLAFLGGFILKALAYCAVNNHISPITAMFSAQFCKIFIRINLGLAFFNLLPFPPLDGSRIIAYVIPNKYYLQYRVFEQIAPMIFLFLFIFGLFSAILTPALNAGYSWLNTFMGNPIEKINLCYQTFVNSIHLTPL